MRVRLIVALTLAALNVFFLFSACQRSASQKIPVNQGSVQPTPTATPTSTPEPDLSINNFLTTVAESRKEKILGLRRSWNRIPEHEKYRVARQDEFERRVTLSEYGEIAGAHGLALFVVDKTKTENDRFSLIIFIERPGNRYDTYWIYRDLNLKAHSLSRASGSLFVEEIRPDRSRNVCLIQWTRAKRQWTCEPLPIS